MGSGTKKTLYFSEDDLNKIGVIKEINEINRINKSKSTLIGEMLTLFVQCKYMCIEQFSNAAIVALAQGDFDKLMVIKNPATQERIIMLKDEDNLEGIYKNESEELKKILHPDDWE